MKRIIRFSRFFFPAAVVSVVIAVTGIAGYIAKGGFNLGIDFRAGLIQELQFAPTAFSLTWSGMGNAAFSFDRNGLYIVISGAGVEGKTYSFPYTEYRTLGDVERGFSSQVEGLSVNLNARPEVDSRWLVFSTQGNPNLRSTPYAVHYLDPQGEPISVASVREALTSLGQTVSVQNMGQPSDRHFMIRIEDRDNQDEEGVPVEQIISVLEGVFGSGEVALLRSDYVGSRFSKDLTDQAGILLALTLLLILIYASIRFKPQYAFSAVIAIIHDALVIVAFIVWTRMEFSTTTIAAILTILGYSINDTIVIFDRIRENRRIRPDDVFIDVLNRSLTETLSRTIITTVTTMLAVVFLFIFSSGSMRDFALALLVGMVSGVFSTIFIASGFLNFWEIQKSKRDKRKLMGAPARVKA
ncbi:MAG: protein translocase subunit SecF [Treponema sp.]|jgi:preprotein translocase subunit SecF|nr:protein translocase subunit SecF [Treponema sp.]